MIRVWGRRSSSNVQAVLWGLEELRLQPGALQGHDIERIDAGFTYGVTDTPAYLGMNPNGTVPTVQIDDEPPLWESAAILRHLSTRYGTAPFWPQDEVARAHVDRWAEWAKLNIAMNFTGPVFWQVVRTPIERRDQQRVDKGLATLHRYLRIAETQLARSPFIAGEALTLADIQLGHCLYRYFDIDIPRDDLPHLFAYYQRLVARMPYAQHVMVAYDELVNSM